MNINLFNKIKHKKDGRLDPHSFWSSFLTIFLVVFIFEILGFTYFFIKNIQKLDATPAANLETNFLKINTIEKTVQTTEESVKNRTME